MFAGHKEGLFTFIFLEIVLRPFNISIAWSGEAARFLFVWVIYLGISYAIRNGRHIRVLALVKLLPVKTQQFLNLVSNLVFLSYQGIVLYHAIKITEKSFRLGQLAPAMEIPLAFLYVCLVVSAALSIIRLSITIKRDISILFNISENNAVTKQA